MPALASKIHPAEFFQRPCDNVVGGHRVAHVGRKADKLSAGLSHEACSLVHVVLGGERVGHRRDLLKDVAGDDVRALTSERDSMRAALASGAAGDHHDASLESLFRRG